MLSSGSVCEATPPETADLDLVGAFAEALSRTALIISGTPSAMRLM